MRSLLILLCLSVDVYANTSATKPNIVLIFVDDMGYGDPGCCGGSLVPTPNINSLTEPGIRFTQGYSVSAVRQGDWKLVYDADDGEQLFHLGKDPTESQDRWQQEPELARQLKAALGQLQAEVPPPITPRKSR